MTEDEVATIIVDCSYKVHKALGPGLLESTYEACLAHELVKAGLNVKNIGLGTKRVVNGL